MYNEVYELWKKEKEHEDLQRLPTNFYSKITSYYKKLKVENRMLDKKTPKAQLLHTEISYFKVMVGELLCLRYQKLQEKALCREPVPSDTLSEEEKKLYESALPLSEEYYAFSKDILRGHLSVVKKGSKQDTCVLRFVQEITSLIGADMKTYGPFMPEDIATLPQENARILVKQGLAVQVDAK
ncbi:MAG: hypothetical protein IAX21_05305 [Candidatus Bathyarchaeota archaeon]|nr:MAG: hypothetical protein NUK63_00480 [Candidatus Bathyarchaeum tardum]WNZ30264.1 MAG: hypothetical protein IAX21_05305 [Candidatus Bathyarchaeota archaeon]